MTQEQKARAYDEVVNKLRHFITQGVDPLITRADVQDFFTELAESEDENIRKGIIDFLWKEKIFLQEAHSSVENNPKYRFVMDAIAWLEKQNSNVDNANKEYWRGYREGKQEILDKYAELEKQGEQKPAAWSEEDEKIALSIEQVMNCASLLNIVPEKVDKIRTWLKSLKERYTWKPSDEQMLALEAKLTMPPQSLAMTSALIELYQNLKKLKG